MFIYEKKLQFPVRIATPNPKLAAFIISQYGGSYINRLQYTIRVVSITIKCRQSFCSSGILGIFIFVL